jgi:hypothetical protein
MTRAVQALVALAMLGACESESDPKAEAGRAECRKLMGHIFQITPRPGGSAPETDPAAIQALVAAVPVEDLDQCASASGKVIACMQAATDFPALRACIPAQGR